MKYEKSLIDNLNKVIKSKYPHLKTIEEDYKITHESISRMVMLDRYAQKDANLSTLQVGDLVLVVITQHAKFPTRGVGVVKSIKANDVTVKLDEEYITYNDGKSEITRTKKDIVKPLEIFYEQIAFRVGHALSSIEKTAKEKKD
jgi:ribonucleoside-diphosphate reductase alpha chain